MRKKFDYQGVSLNELSPNHHVPHTVERGCGERTKYIKSYRLCQYPTCGKRYTLPYGDYILIDEKGEKRR